VALGDLTDGAFRSQALAASANGLTIVGDSDSANGTEAFLWNGTMSGLGDLAGGAFDSQAFGVSPNGLLVVGRGESASGDEAFLYQSGPGMVGLGDLPGGTFESVAYDVTDGGVVVGSSASAAGPEAFLWSGGTIYSLLDVLVANGLAAQVAGWTLVEARAISDDGLTIAGWGFNPNGDSEAWITTIGFVPEPSTGLLFSLGLGLLAHRRSSRAHR
jgi:probable HAF family extracellular repeat protein